MEKGPCFTLDTQGQVDGLRENKKFVVSGGRPSGGLEGVPTPPTKTKHPYRMCEYFFRDEGRGGGGLDAGLCVCV